MAKSRLAPGWYPAPGGPDRFRYWDGKTWAGFHESGMTRFHLRGWRSIWYGRVVRFPGVFYPLAWFNCSVPMTRGRLNRLMRPAHLGMAVSRGDGGEGPGGAGVREPRRPYPSQPGARAAGTPTS